MLLYRLYVFVAGEDALTGHTKGNKAWKNKV
jgi:hypothetical protein